MTGTARGDGAVVLVRALGAQRDGPLEYCRVGRDGYIDDDEAIRIDETEAVRGVVTAETERNGGTRFDGVLSDHW
jgi:hypothetical protein